MSKKNETKVAPWVHSIAGGCGGALGAILTNPLEVLSYCISSFAAVFGHKISKIEKPKFLPLEP